ncbi:DnaB-like helicase N-terminal domain-containing protein [Streptomyces sp. NPDC058287]|uniref:DnaB-like helicase N-terminal domain-containing protein n=1 Tax=Streptomyces sp. NPDC058287 TaxID=3346423 RepID=UPI0036EFCBB0
MKRLTRKAEEALLGAAVLRPEELTQLRWIPAGAFSRPDHAALWQTLHAVDWSTVEPSQITQTLTQAVDQIEEQGIRQMLSPVRLSQLVDVCPSPGSAPLYGGMTLEAAIHRSVEHSGEQLRRTARQTEVDQAQKALEQAAKTGQRFESLDAAWKAAPEMVRTLLDTQPAQAIAPVPRTERARTDLQAEVDTVASLLHQPGQLAEVKGWLQKADFTHPQLSAAYQAMRTLDERHAPIDPLTVAWEAQRHPGAQPSEQVLGELEQTGMSGGAASWAGERVLYTSALDRLDAAGHEIRNLGRHPSLAPGALVGHAEQSLRPVHADHERLQHAAREPELASDKEPAPGRSRRTPELAATDHEMEI